MQVTIKHLLSAALMTSFVFAAQPSPVLANYDAGDARHDQSIINRLTAEGAINPNQAVMMDQSAINRANGSWWHRNMTPMMTGVPVNPLIGGISTAPMFGGIGTNSAGFLSRGQARSEMRQVDQLLRDHAISPMQAAQMKAQINAEVNRGYGGGGIVNNGGYNQPSILSAMAPALVGHAYPTNVYPTNVYPTNYYNNNSSLWQRAHNHFHY